MHDCIPVIQYYPEIILKSLHAEHLLSELLLHPSENIVGNCRHRSRGIRIADHEIISDGRSDRPEVKGNHILRLLLKHCVSYDFKYFIFHFDKFSINDSKFVFKCANIKQKSVQ